MGGRLVTRDSLGPGPGFGPPLPSSHLLGNWHRRREPGGASPGGYRRRSSIPSLFRCPHAPSVTYVESALAEGQEPKPTPPAEGEGCREPIRTQPHRCGPSRGRSGASGLLVVRDLSNINLRARLREVRRLLARISQSDVTTGGLPPFRAPGTEVELYSACRAYDDQAGGRCVKTSPAPRSVPPG
jgi:hypothetical protein